MTGPPRGYPRRGAVVREGAEMAGAQPIASLLVVLAVAACCGIALATTGQSSAAEQQVLATIDAAGTRTLVATDVDGSAGLRPGAVDRVAALSGVEWVVGLEAVVDVRPVRAGPGEDAVPLRVLHGDLPPVLRLDRGRWPLGDEVVAGPSASRRLGFSHVVGGVQSGLEQWAVVGSFRSADPLSWLGDGLVAFAPAEGTRVRLRSIHVVAGSQRDVAVLSQSIPAVLGAEDPHKVRLETPEELVLLRQAVSGDLGAFSRRLVALVLLAGLGVVAVTVLGAVTLRRRDFGRRRALGASRSAIVALVLVHTGLAALVGAVLGSAVGTVAVARLAGSLPSARFTAGVALLAVLSALVAAVGPAVVAALRDPVRILRVP